MTIESSKSDFKKCKKNVTGKKPVTFHEALILKGWANFVGFRIGRLIPMPFEALGDLL